MKDWRLVYGILTVMHGNSRLQGKDLELSVLNFISRRYLDTINDRYIYNFYVEGGGWLLGVDLWEVVMLFLGDGFIGF